jgi:hypothetical protein
LKEVSGLQEKIRRTKINYSEEINENTELYRYMGLSQFMSLIENRETYLTQIKKWEDPWEGVLDKIPHFGTDGNKLTNVGLNFMYGQCWTRYDESDALWRIYSPNKEGLLVKTTAKKFSLYENIHLGYLGYVHYFKNFGEIDLKKDYKPPYMGCLLKRKAFQHEGEIRLIVHYDNIDDSVETKKYDMPKINIKVNPFDFIEDIVIDPRSSDWFVQSIFKYCYRAGFNIIPRKSALYSEEGITNEKRGLILCYDSEEE